MTPKRSTKTTIGAGPIGASCLLVAILILIGEQLMQINANDSSDYIEQYFRKLYKSDTCGSIYTSKRHGYDLEAHRVVTRDKYVLTLHRLIHPSDFSRTNQIKCNKKPYLLLHGLLGTSAGYLINVEQDYEAPGKTFAGMRDQLQLAIGSSSSSRSYQKFISMADNWGKRFRLDENKLASASRSFKLPIDFGRLELIDFDRYDPKQFGRRYKQANERFMLPQESRKFITNSLAMTLSNFGYDVWLINLRGNKYSPEAANSHDSAEYWDFGMETLIDQDLRAATDYVEQLVGCHNHPMGFVAYSYSNMHLLGFLAQKQVGRQVNQKRFQPIIMLAPTMLTPAPGREKLRLLLKGAQKLIISHNGPFPGLNEWGSSGGLIQRAVPSLRASACRLPIAAKLCHLFELLLHGESDQVSSLSRILAPRPKSESEMWRQKLIELDSGCGRTSKRHVRQIIERLISGGGAMDFDPSKNLNENHSNQRQLATPPPPPPQRSVILIHAQNDEVSSPEEVRRIRDGPLRNLALVDFVIKEPRFGHTHFLYGRENEYLVNAEALRFALLYDYLLYPPSELASRHEQHDNKQQQSL